MTRLAELKEQVAWYEMKTALERQRSYDNVLVRMRSVGLLNDDEVELLREDFKLTSKLDGT